MGRQFGCVTQRPLCDTRVVSLSMAKAATAGTYMGSTWGQFRSVTAASSPQPVPCHECRAHTGPSCSSNDTLRGKGASAGKGENTDLNGAEPHGSEPPGLLLHQLEIQLPPPPNKEVMVTEQRGKPCLTAGSTQPLHLQPYLLPRGQHTPGKDADSC